MGADGLMCVRVSERGKWHVIETVLAQLTACGEKIVGPKQMKNLELVDSADRCRADGCRMARARAKGLA